MARHCHLHRPASFGGLELLGFFNLGDSTLALEGQLELALAIRFQEVIVAQIGQSVLSEPRTGKSDERVL